MSSRNRVFGHQTTHKARHQKPRRLTAAIMSLALLFMTMVGTGAMATGVANAAPTTGTISGTVTNPNGTPAANVDVQLDNGGNGQYYDTQSLADGSDVPHLL